MHKNQGGAGKKTITILLPGGALTRKMLNDVGELCSRYSFEMYLSTAQNLRLYNIEEAEFEALRDELLALGLNLKGPGRFPLPRICIGNRSCNLGQIDTMEFSGRIMEHFGGMTDVKPKLKIALSGCPAACSGALLTDIGVVATRQGYDVYVGGKGGPLPKIGKRIARQADEERVMEIIGEVVDYHQVKTSKKQRLSKLVGDPGFPFQEEV